MTAANVPLLQIELLRTGTVYRAWVGDHHYTGSTFRSLHARIANHHARALTGGCKFHKHVLANGGWEAVRWLVLEAGPFTPSALLKRESSFVNTDDVCCLNQRHPVAWIPPPVVFKGDRTEEKRAYDTAYYESRKEALKQQRRDRYAEDRNDPDKMARIAANSKVASARYRAAKKAEEAEMFPDEE